MADVARVPDHRRWRRGFPAGRATEWASRSWSITIKSRKDRDGENVFDPNGQPQVFNRGRINWWGRSEDWADKLGFRGPQDVESPGLEWTHIEAVVSGNRLHFVNGKLVNEGTDSSFTEGKIMIQSEGAEIYFRRIDLEPLK